MSLEGLAQTEYASLSGKIHTLVIDKTLSISGAAADAKATGEAIDKVVDAAAKEATDMAVEAAFKTVQEHATEVATNAALNAVETEVDKAFANLHIMTADDVSAICV